MVLAEAQAERLGEPLGLGESERLAVALGLWLTDCVAEAQSEGDGEPLGLCVALAHGLAEPEAEAQGEGDCVPLVDCERERVPEPVGQWLTVGVPDLLRVGEVEVLRLTVALAHLLAVLLPEAQREEECVPLAVCEREGLGEPEEHLVAVGETDALRVGEGELLGLLLALAHLLTVLLPEAQREEECVPLVDREREGLGEPVEHLLAAAVADAQREGEGELLGLLLALEHLLAVGVPEAQGEGEREPLADCELEWLGELEEHGLPEGVGDALVDGEGVPLRLAVPLPHLLAVLETEAQVEEEGEREAEGDLEAVPQPEGDWLRVREGVAVRQGLEDCVGLRLWEAEPLVVCDCEGVTVLLAH